MKLIEFKLFYIKWSYEVKIKILFFPWITVLSFNEYTLSEIKNNK